MPNQVDEKDKKDRANKLIRVSEVLENKYESKYLGKEMYIITEVNHQGEIVGFTENYIKVIIDNPEGLESNMYIKVKLLNKDGEYVHALYIK